MLELRLEHYRSQLAKALKQNDKPRIKHLRKEIQKIWVTIAGI